jgi:formyltetrahydrofolate deformylase
MVAPSDRELIIALSCRDALGILHAVSGFLAAHGCDILTSQQSNDVASNRFFMRVHSSYKPETSIDALRSAFRATAESYSMDWSLTDVAARPNVLLMVSKAEHCMSDLLYRYRARQLKVEIPAIVSNHRALEPVADFYGIPFHHIPVTSDCKPVAEAKLLELVEPLAIDLVVLARFMHILSDDLCDALEGRAINIHHSFLPGFKGAKPYHQAFERGVTLVGATAHYITAELDEGPIIEQEVPRVDHNFEPEVLVIAGQDAERAALSRAVQWPTERRVLRNGHRTVVFK